MKDLYESNSTCIDALLDCAHLIIMVEVFNAIMNQNVHIPSQHY